MKKWRQIFWLDDSILREPLGGLTNPGRHRQSEDMSRKYSEVRTLRLSCFEHPRSNPRYHRKEFFHSLICLYDIIEVLKERGFVSS